MTVTLGEVACTSAVNCSPIVFRSAADEVLTNPVYGEQARRRSLAFTGRNGAQLAADSVESMLPVAG